jgi:hypothetical protein
MSRFALSFWVGLTAACSLFGEGEALLPKGGGGTGGGGAAPPICEAEPGDLKCGSYSPHCDGVCFAGAPDGVCDAGPLGVEPCACSDCTDEIACLELTDNDGRCEIRESEDETIADTCMSEDCYLTGFCYTVLDSCCNHDGVCEPLREACNCADCQAVPHCQLKVETCVNEATDGACDTAEPCSCPDCAAEVRCALTTCVADGECTTNEACICPECFEDEECGCVPLDSVCDPLSESCDCEDCARDPACASGSGGGVAEGGSGGA